MAHHGRYPRLRDEGRYMLIFTRCDPKERTSPRTLKMIDETKTYIRRMMGVPSRVEWLPAQ